MSSDYASCDQEYLLGRNEPKKTKNKCALSLSVGIISGCLGISLGILGPTLPCLETVTETREDQISLVFTGRAVGALSGLLLARLLISGSPVFVSPRKIAGYGLLLLAIVNFIIPWPTFFWWLLPLFAVQGGAIAAILEGCLSSFSSLSWRYFNHIQRFIFFTTVIGCALAPIISLPFFPDPFSVKSYNHLKLKEQTNEDLPLLHHVRHKRNVENATIPLNSTESFVDISNSTTSIIASVLSTQNQSQSIMTQSSTINELKSTSRPKTKSSKPTITNGDILDQGIENADGSNTAVEIKKILDKQHKNKIDQVIHSGKTTQKENMQINTSVSPNNSNETDIIHLNDSASNITTEKTSSSLEDTISGSNLSSTSAPTSQVSLNSGHDSIITSSQTQGENSVTAVKPSLNQSTLSTVNNSFPTTEIASVATVKEISSQNTTPLSHQVKPSDTPLTHFTSNGTSSPQISTSHGEQTVTSTRPTSVTSSINTLSTGGSSLVHTETQSKISNEISSSSPIQHDSVTMNSISNATQPSAFDFKILGRTLKTVHKIYICLGLLTLAACLFTAPMFLCYSCCSKKERNTALRSALSDEDALGMMANSSNSPYRHHLDDRSQSPGGLHYCVSNMSMWYLLALLITFLLSVLASGMQVSFGGFLYSFSVRYLQWTQFRGLMITSLFWVCLSLGHFLSLSPCWSPFPSLLLHQVTAFVSSIVMAIIQPYHNQSVWFWLCVGIFGLGLAGLSSSLNSWIFSLSRTESPLTSTFQVGCIVGEMFIPVIIGYLHRTTTHPTIFLNVILVCCSAYVFLFFILLILVKKKHFPGAHFLGRPPPNFEYVIQSTDNEDEPGDTVPLTKTTQIINGHLERQKNRLENFPPDHKNNSKTSLLNENDADDLDELGL